MANMSYCMFENTLGDLKQCVTAMEEACTFDELDLNQYEMDAYHDMKQLCERFLAQYSVLEESMADEDLDDTVSEAQEWHDFDPEC